MRPQSSPFATRNYVLSIYPILRRVFNDREEEDGFTLNAHTVALIPCPSSSNNNNNNNSSGSSSGKHSKREKYRAATFLSQDRALCLDLARFVASDEASTTQISRPTVGQWGCTNSRGGKHAPWTKTDDRDEDGIYSKFGWLVVRIFFTRRFERFRSTSFRRDNRDRNGRTSHSHVPFLSAIIVITIEHRRASHSDWERREGGEKKCVETCRSIEARSTQLLRNAIHSITYVFIRQIGDERTASTRKWKLAANSYGFWRLSGFLTTPSANCLILKKKKKKYQKCLERSNKRYALYIFVSFSLTRFQLFHPSPLPRKETYNCLSKSNEKKEKLF